MSNNIGMFLLFSVLVTGLVINPSVSPISFDSVTGDSKLSSNLHFAFAQETENESSETNGTSSTNSTSIEIKDGLMISEDTTGINDTSTNSVSTEDEISDTVLSPLKQIKSGIVPENVICKQGLELVFKLNGQPACVKTTSIQKLITWGWTQ
jgi:hypothetical protein